MRPNPTPSSPGARRALALLVRLQVPARRAAAVAAVVGAQGLRKLLLALRPVAVLASGSATAAPAAGGALHAVQRAGYLVLGLAGGLLWRREP